MPAAITKRFFAIHARRSGGANAAHAARAITATKIAAPPPNSTHAISAIAAATGPWGSRTDWLALGRDAATGIIGVYVAAQGPDGQRLLKALEIALVLADARRARGPR